MFWTNDEIRLMLDALDELSNANFQERSETHEQMWDRLFEESERRGMRYGEF